MHVTNKQFQGFRQECLRRGFQNGWGVLPQKKKNQFFLIFSAQNGLFQLKWQQNMEYIFIWCWVGGSDPRLAETLSSRTSSKRPIYCQFSHFTSIIWPCGPIITSSSIMAAGYCRVCSCLKMLLKFKMAARGLGAKTRNYSNFTMTFGSIWRRAGDFFKVLLKFKMAATDQLLFFCEHN